MEAQFWIGRWKEGRMGFHQEKVHPDLLQFRESFLGNRSHHVLVPLAGKTWDIPWLVQHGHQVTAFELSEVAAQQFHQEHNLEPTVQQAGPYTLYETPGCRFFVGDVFDATPELVGPADRIWDRAALVALNPEQRRKYSAHLTDLLSPGGVMLLNTFRYGPGTKEGPPHSLEEWEVFEHYGQACTIELVKSADEIEAESRWRDLGFTYWIASTWRITKRAG